MRAAACVRAVAGPGGTRLTHVSGEPPLVPRQTGPSSVHLVGAAGGPLPGDETHLDLHVGPGAVLVVAQVAATVAQRGLDPEEPPSVARVRARVASGGLLVVAGRPLVAARGCRHRVSALVELDGDARLVWRDLLVPSRSGEEGGSVSTHLRVERSGAPVLDTELVVGLGPDALGGARCGGTLAVVGWEVRDVVRRPGAVLVPLAAPLAGLVTALGHVHQVERAVAELAALVLDEATAEHLLPS